jgi:hypothetical protein
MVGQDMAGHRGVTTKVGMSRGHTTCASHTTRDFDLCTSSQGVSMSGLQLTSVVIEGHFIAL